MPITKNPGRQEIKTAEVAFTAVDIASGFNPAIELPGNAVVVGGNLFVDTAFGGTSPTLSVGDSVSGTRFLGATSVSSAGRTALVPTQFITGAPQDIGVTPGGTLNTVGAARLQVEYYIRGRSNSTQD